MRLASGSQILRADVISGLRDMARNGSELMEMVRFVQRELDLPQELSVPIFAYFSQAFCLPLRDVLPLREWLQYPDETLIPELRDRLYRWKFMRTQTFEDREVSSTDYDQIKAKMRSLPKDEVSFRVIEEPSGGGVRLTGSVVFLDPLRVDLHKSESARQAEVDREWKEILAKFDAWGFVRIGNRVQSPQVSSDVTRVSI